jgi:hypothetical protein
MVSPVYSIIISWLVEEQRVWRHAWGPDSNASGDATQPISVPRSIPQPMRTPDIRSRFAGTLAYGPIDRAAHQTCCHTCQRHRSFQPVHFGSYGKVGIRIQFRMMQSTRIHRHDETSKRDLRLMTVFSSVSWPFHLALHSPGARKNLKISTEWLECQLIKRLQVGVLC